LPVGSMETAVDRQNHTVHEHRVVAGKKGDHTGNVFGCGRPADREAIAKGVHDCLAFLELCSGLAGGEARRDGVDAHTARPVFQRESAREVRDRPCRSRSLDEHPV
jgi:hypothetical protein